MTAHDARSSLALLHGDEYLRHEHRYLKGQLDSVSDWAHSTHNTDANTQSLHYSDAASFSIKLSISARTNCDLVHNCRTIGCVVWLWQYAFIVCNQVSALSANWSKCEITFIMTQTHHRRNLNSTDLDMTGLKLMVQKLLKFVKSTTWKWFKIFQRVHCDLRPFCVYSVSFVDVRRRISTPDDRRLVRQPRAIDETSYNSQHAKPILLFQELILALQSTMAVSACSFGGRAREHHLVRAPLAALITSPRPWTVKGTQAIETYQHKTT